MSNCTSFKTFPNPDFEDLVDVLSFVPGDKSVIKIDTPSFCKVYITKIKNDNPIFEVKSL